MHQCQIETNHQLPCHITRFPIGSLQYFAFFSLGVVITFILWCSFKDAWTLARILDSRDSWIELGKKAIYHLDIELGELNKAYFRICYGLNREIFSRVSIVIRECFVLAFLRTKLEPNTT